MLTKAPRGTRDLLPEECTKWVFLENIFREICGQFGYREIRTPTFEHTELFQRGIGETTDIVEKEMYTFSDKSGRSITLKPEGTAPVARAYIEHKLYNKPMPVKLFYITPCFRYERPQAGRQREFHQFGIEAFGSPSPLIDVEVITLAVFFLKRLGLDSLEVRINSIGCERCREDYKKALEDFLFEKANSLCDTCKVRLGRNTLRILDCKDPGCQKLLVEAPVILEYLCDNCRGHFDEVKKGLSALDVKYSVDPGIVRGLDYYTKTVFEIISKDLGAQSTVCGGGRYDHLVEECGGPPTPAAGFGIGIERLIMVLEANGLLDIPPIQMDVFIAVLDETYRDYGLKLLYRLRMAGFSAETDYVGRSLKAQMKYADKIPSKYAFIIGEDEVKTGIITVKDLTTGEQEKVPCEEVETYLKNKIRKGC
ncbi:histidine--tRNA ligase [Thermosediminibacter oceani]|uniref:Histidine--tRNA ligase n=1 Tax=Thermosediminibacter oceani (strain ATCC BAA-1034 / DSM 16646 / JW/IW-1228P) TaxID=555079 RepID=D9RXP0_THEOJ|nr:histidine--tRNA ligase [Thermosediminibacter oceani]ADL08114.1 histidyl-tRNA synthetase [Thermosediminibacter oceani DSM 16646]